MSDPQRRLMADCGSAIRRVAVAMPPEIFRPEQSERLDVYLGLCTALAAHADVTILCEEGSDAELRPWLSRIEAPRMPTIAATAPVGGLQDRGYWIRDSFLCAEAAGTSKYLVPSGQPPESPAGWLAEMDGATIEPICARIAGGNCLVGPDFWLVGIESVSGTAEAVTQGDLGAAEAAIRNLDERPLTLVGYDPETADGCRYQPWFHLDLFMTVTGRVMNGKPELLLAEPLSTPDPEGPRNRLYAPHVEAVAERLRRSFELARNPVPFVPTPGSREPRLRAYNNALVQNDPPIVWLPQFADREPEMRAADLRNRTIWEDRGFSVVPVFGWSGFVNASGALRCATKVLGR
ncbi:hypothetical protein [Dongia sp. agr-C8]